MIHPRPPDRIDRMVELLRQAWHNFPDFRLTQLVMALTDKPEDAGAVWQTEDDVMEEKLVTFVSSSKSANH